MYRVQFTINDGINDGTYIINETSSREEAVKALKEGKRRAKKVVAAYETIKEFYGNLDSIQEYNYHYEKARLDSLVMINLNPKKSKKN